MYKIIALIGKAGSGKDTILHKLIKAKPDFNEIISCTTRPIRDNETNGVNYYFLTNEQFANKILKGEMVECGFFNNWGYGTPYSSLQHDCYNIGVFNPDGVEAMLDCADIDLTVYYIQAADKTRLLRQLNREQNPNVSEIIRRYGTDEHDFLNLDYILPNNILINETMEDIDKIVCHILQDITD